MGSISKIIMLEPSSSSMSFVYYYTLVYIFLFFSCVTDFLIKFPHWLENVNGIVGVLRIRKWF
jgi:hypothetical protein